MATSREDGVNVEPVNAPTLEEFQSKVTDLLLRHRSLIDVMTKFGQSSASVNRSVSKAITDCGCIELNARKQQYSDELNLEDAKTTLQSHLSGQMCEHCRDAIQNELGRNLFYMTALCNLMDIELDEVISKEYDKCSTLGLFNLR